MILNIKFFELGGVRLNPRVQNISKKPRNSQILSPSVLMSGKETKNSKDHI